MTNENFTTTFYSLSLPWNKNLGNCQEAKNLITLTSRTINNADNFCEYLYPFTGFCVSIYYRIKFSHHVFLLEKSMTCHICMNLWE